MRCSLLFPVLISSSLGCLYTESINTPPQATLEISEEREYFRGDRIAFSAGKSFDSDGDRLFYAFDGEVCGREGDGPPMCEALTDLSADRAQVRVDVPAYLPGQELVAVDLVRARVTVTDGRGALSEAEVSWPVGNAPPSVMLQAQSDFEKGDNQFPASLPINIVARVGDVDDDPALTTLEWRIASRPVASQTGSFTFEELTGPTVLDPTYQLTPDVPGAWEIAVVATDVAGTMIEESIMLSVVGDTAPCIGDTNRDASFMHLLDADAAPTPFSVLEVLDEFDPYPAGPSGATEFRWSILEPGEVVFRELSGDASSFSIDPVLYAPGDDIELRVEVLDRVAEHEPLCAASEPICSVTSDGCLQRQTWSVGIR